MGRLPIASARVLSNVRSVRSLGLRRRRWPRYSTAPVLSPYRVLDLTTARGLLCGQMLGDLGADVIAVEPPEGNPARRLGPFAGDVRDPERSLYWWAYSRNKRSVTA